MRVIKGNGIGMTPLLGAVRLGLIEIGMTPLHETVRHIFRWNEIEMTPLHEAVRHGFFKKILNWDDSTI